MSSAPFSATGWRILPAPSRFRVILAPVPFLLFLLALMGFLNLEEIWRSDVAPEFKKKVSDAAYRLFSSRSRSARQWAHARSPLSRSFGSVRSSPATWTECWRSCRSSSAGRLRARARVRAIPQRAAR
jgi:hypothetical protein